MTRGSTSYNAKQVAGLVAIVLVTAAVLGVAIGVGLNVGRYVAGQPGEIAGGVVAAWAAMAGLARLGGWAARRWY